MGSSIKEGRQIPNLPVSEEVFLCQLLKKMKNQNKKKRNGTKIPILHRVLEKKKLSRLLTVKDSPGSCSPNF
jgi:hypothetical protein